MARIIKLFDNAQTSKFPRPYSNDQQFLLNDVEGTVFFKINGVTAMMLSFL